MRIRSWFVMAALPVLLEVVPIGAPAPASASVPGQEGPPHDIYVMNANGSGRKPLITGPGDDRHPTWSPAARLAFSSNRDGDYDIYTANSYGTLLTQLDGVGDDVDPAYSPDGRRIAFASNRAGNWDIWVINEDGSGLRALTADARRDSQPSWSPDGQRVVFTGFEGTFQVWVVNADGTGLAKLTAGTDRDPAWSPNGSRIAFYSGRSGVATMNPDGSDVRPLAQGDEPAWAPTAGRIAYRRIEPGRYYDGGLRVIAADGSGDAPFGEQVGDAGEPAWSRDGGQVAFTYRP